MQMKMPSKQSTCLSNSYQTTASDKTSLFSNKSKLFQHSKQPCNGVVVASSYKQLLVVRRPQANCGMPK